MTSSSIPYGKSSRCFRRDDTEGRRAVCTSFESLHLSKPPLPCCQSTVTRVDGENHFSATITVSIICKSRIIQHESPLTQTAFRNNKTNESKQNSDMESLLTFGCLSFKPSHLKHVLQVYSRYYRDSLFVTTAYNFRTPGLTRSRFNYNKFHISELNINIDVGEERGRETNKRYK